MFELLGSCVEHTCLEACVLPFVPLILIGIGLYILLARQEYVLGGAFIAGGIALFLLLRKRGRKRMD